MWRWGKRETRFPLSLICFPSSRVGLGSATALQIQLRSVRRSVLFQQGLGSVRALQVLLRCAFRRWSRSVPWLSLQQYNGKGRSCTLHYNDTRCLDFHGEVVTAWLQVGKTATLSALEARTRVKGSKFRAAFGPQRP